MEFTLSLSLPYMRTDLFLKCLQGFPSTGFFFLISPKDTSLIPVYRTFFPLTRILQDISVVFSPSPAFINNY